MAPELLAELEGAIGNESQLSKKVRVALLQTEGSEEGKGKGKSKDPSRPKDPPRPKAEGAKSDQPPAKGDSKGRPKPQCHHWTSENGCPFGNGCMYTHDPVVKGKCYNCGSSLHLKPACARPGGGAHDPETDPSRGKGKGKGKPKGKTVAKAHVQNGGGTQPSTDQPASGATGSGGTGGLDNADLKALREVTELLRSMKRLHVSGEVTETSSHESIKQAIESV